MPDILRPKKFVFTSDQPVISHLLEAFLLAAGQLNDIVGLDQPHSIERSTHRICHIVRREMSMHVPCVHAQHPPVATICVFALLKRPRRRPRAWLPQWHRRFGWQRPSVDHWQDGRIAWSFAPGRRANSSADKYRLRKCSGYFWTWRHGFEPSGLLVTTFRKRGCAPFDKVTALLS
jgi:hypothetical protein